VCARGLCSVCGRAHCGNQWMVRRVAFCSSDRRLSTVVLKSVDVLAYLVSLALVQAVYISKFVHSSLSHTTDHITSHITHTKLAPSHTTRFTADVACHDRLVCRRACTGAALCAARASNATPVDLVIVVHVVIVDDETRVERFSCARTDQRRLQRACQEAYDAPRAAECRRSERWRRWHWRRWQCEAQASRRCREATSSTGCGASCRCAGGGGEGGARHQRSQEAVRKAWRRLGWVVCLDAAPCDRRRA
jgi:hypothetical protein